MGRLTVRLDGYDITYLTDGEPVPVSEPIKNLDVLDDRRLLHHERLRRFLLRPMNGWPLFYYLLHWSDGKDLRVLDERVAAGVSTADDFASAIVCELRDVVCGDCEAVVRVATVDSGNPVFAKDRQQRLVEHAFVTACPACSGRLPPYVAEVID
jgi:hypothetical protein